MHMMAGFAAAIAVAAQPVAGDDEAWATAPDLAAARSGAATVVVAYMDSVRQPRGSWGVCPADGQIIVVERGQLPYGRTRLAVGVPCSTQPRYPAHLSPTRRIPMRFLHSRTFARLYLDQRGRLVDYEALQLSPAPFPPGW